MSYIQIAAIGIWDQLPTDVGPFTLEYELLDDEWKEDLIQLGWDQQVLSKPELKLIRQQKHILWAKANLAEPTGTQQVTNTVHLSMAQHAAHLIKQLAHQAVVIYFDPSMKVMTPKVAHDIEAIDPVTLLHMFIDFWGDDEGIYASGMQIFGLPDLHIQGQDPQSAAMQATVFSAAAQMVCEGLQFHTDMLFKASESFPTVRVSQIKYDTVDSEEAYNPYGVVVLSA